MSVLAPIREVTVYDAYERPIGTKSVFHRCKRCEGSIHARHAEHLYWEVVSPQGTEHLGGQNFGETECGIDATGTNWWWQL